MAPLANCTNRSRITRGTYAGPVDALSARALLFQPRTAIDGGRRDSFMDVLMIALVVGFFALSWGFVVLCERLEDRS
jgi:hypothetical protein